jgi:glucose-1-phosphate adenylyltransferase
VSAMSEVLGVIMGGGRGTRIHPLTRDRSKPAVPIAGKYRLIDVPISNCINSGINRIAVLTQFNSVSLHRHIARTYVFDSFHRGWVEILAAEQTPGSDTWYQGTADAVRQQLAEIRTTGARWVLSWLGITSIGWTIPLWSSSIWIPKRTSPWPSTRSPGTKPLGLGS